MSTEEEGEADHSVLLEDEDDGRLGRRGILTCNCGLKVDISPGNKYSSFELFRLILVGCVLPEDLFIQPPRKRNTRI